MTQVEQKAVEEFTEMNLTKKSLYHYNDMQDAFLIGLFKGEKMQSSLPSNLDEAANNYGLNIRLGYPRVMDETDKFIYNAFKAGAEWMAGQGVVLNLSIDELSCGAYNACVKQGLTSEDDVIIQIRKK